MFAIDFGARSIKVAKLYKNYIKQVMVIHSIIMGQYLPLKTV